MSEDKQQHGETQTENICEELNFDAVSNDLITNESSEEHTTDDWMDILGNGQLKKKVIKKGKNGTTPNRGDTCTLKIIGKLKDGTLVEEYNNLVIQLGDMEVIQGLDLAIALMNLNEVAEIEIDPRFAYGNLGRLPDIPPAAVITYTVELKAIEFDVEKEMLSINRRKEIGNKKRERGNWWFMRNEPTLAIQCYRRALEFLLPAENGASLHQSEAEESVTDAELQALLEDRMKVYNNLAAAQMKSQAYDIALESVENVLSCQPQNVKALYRKGKILHCKGEHMQAYAILLQATKLKPDSAAIKAELAILKKKNAKDVQHEKNLYRKMFGTNKEANNLSKTSKEEGKNGSTFLWSLIGTSVVIMSVLIYKLTS